jgi:hypothetical protein
MNAKSAGAGAASGCVIWVIAFGMLCSCLLPVAGVVGALGSTFGAEFVAVSFEQYLCPEGTTAEVHTYQTTISDDFGGQSPATGYETRCVDASGNVVKDLGPMAGFAFTGLLLLAGLLLSALLAFIFAAPVGALVTRFMSRRQNARSAPVAS